MNSGPSAKPKVAVILVNYNSAKLTEECVRSLVATGYPNLLIVAVDNGSRSGELEPLQALAQCEPALVVLPLGYNAGFTKGNNAGMDLALQKYQAEYLWILNNDTEVRADAIELSLRAFTEGKVDPRDTIVSSIITYAENDKIWCNGLRDLAWVNFPKSVDKGRLAAEVAQPGLVLTKAEYSIGCSMFVSREFVQRHGRMNEDYFMYYDDLDFSLGRNNVFIQQPLVKHKVSASAGHKGSARFKPLQAYLFPKYGIHFYFRRKKIPAYQKFIYVIFTTWVFVLLYVRDWTTLKAHCKGLWEGLMKPDLKFQPQ